MPDPAQMAAAVRGYVQAYNDRDKAAFFDIFADDIVHEDPVGYVTRRGKAELAELWEMAIGGDIDLRLNTVVPRGNEAMAILECETGPAGARRRTAPIIDHFVFNDEGKVISVRAFYEFG